VSRPPTYRLLDGNPFCGPELTGTASPAKHLHHLQIRGAVTMNWDRIEGNWTELKGKIQKQWGKLTNDDLDVIEGKRMELSGRLQQRYGYAKDQADREIDNWMNSAA
jgi:uncharacterized protein YjbJ (UPF0337 family)